MSTTFSHFNTPGFQTERNAEESQVYYGGRHGEVNIVDNAYILDSASIDSANTPTTTIRGGAVLMLQSTGKVIPYLQSNKQGVIVGVLPVHTSTLVNSVATDKWIPAMVGGLLRFEELWNGNLHAAAMLKARGFRFNNETKNFLPRTVGRINLVTTSQTPTIADHATQWIVNSGSPLTVSVPRPNVAGMVGYYFEVTRVGAGTVTVRTDGSSLDFDDPGGGGTPQATVAVTGGATFRFLNIVPNGSTTPLYYKL